MTKKTGAMFSVIVPTFNRENAIVRCLESLVCQDYENFEVLICDDGSTDGTKAQVTKFKDKLDLKYFFQKNSGGPAGPRNLGISASNGDFIALLDSDDYWSRDKLSRANKAINSSTEVLFHDMVIEDQTNKLGFWKPLSQTAPRSLDFRTLLLDGNPIFNSSVILNRSLFDKYGMFDEDRELSAAEDYDMWLRLAKAKCKFEKIDGELGYYVVAGDNISSARSTIRTIGKIGEKYRTDIGHLNGGRSPWWMQYELLKAKSYSNSFKEKSIDIWNLFQSDAPRKFKFRAILNLVYRILAVS